MSDQRPPTTGSNASHDCSTADGPALLCGFVPPYLLRKLADDDRSLLPSDVGHQTLLLDQALRTRRASAPTVAPRQAVAEQPPATERIVHDTHNSTALPGDRVRGEGDPATGDVTVDEAYDSSGQVVGLFTEVFGRRSFDDQGAPVLVTVHYAEEYDNAFWDGEQLVFGDGDGVVFERFTKPMDVMAHEFAHAVTQYTAGLRYQDQSGALNESVSDVFASMTRQRMLGQTSEEADWLIGVGLFKPSVQARALRSMLEPGTAYDDPQLGKDPQVGSMSDYVDTTDDNGGVHLNSGIPNRAFALTARALGGHSWERAGVVWYDALTSGEVQRSTDFAGFAAATIASAERRFADDPSVAEQVRAAWVGVGVLSGDQPAPADPATPTDPADPAPTDPAPTDPADPTDPAPAPADPTDPVDPAPADPAEPDASPVVAVQRRGGFAGAVRQGTIDLANDPQADEVRALLRRVDLQTIAPTRPAPDRFVYTVEYGHVRVNLGEQDLTPELSRVVQIALGGSERSLRLD